MEIKEHEIVRYSNQLIDIYDFDFDKEKELDIFIAIIYATQKNESLIQFKTQDIKRLIQTSNLTYKEFKQYVRSLAKTPLRYRANEDIIENDKLKVRKGDYVEEFFFDKLIFSKDEEYITVQIKESFKVLISDLRREFSKHSLKEFFMLSGKYSKLLFMHINRWKNYKNKIFWSEDRLRDKLKVPKNYKFSKIEERILEKSRKEIITKTDIFFDYEIDRKNKTVEFKAYNFEKKLLNDFLEKLGKKDFEELSEPEKRLYNLSLRAKKEKEGIEWLRY